MRLAEIIRLLEEYVQENPEKVPQEKWEEIFNNLAESVFARKAE